MKEDGRAITENEYLENRLDFYVRQLNFRIDQIMKRISELEKL